MGPSSPSPQPAARSSGYELAITALGALLLIGLLPVLHATGQISTFTLSLWGKYLCYALLAISVNLLWGYTGLLSLGQALFFALGGYMHGMYLMRMIGDLGQYHKPIPDFLVFLGWTKLPAFWEPFASFPFAFAMVFLVPGLNETLRVNGRAVIDTDQDLCDSFAVDGKAPKSVLVITIETVFFQCARALLRSRLWDPAAQVPRSDLPSVSALLAEASAGREGGDAYDRSLAERIPKTLY